MTSKKTVLLVLGLVFVIGAGWIIYKGRPVMKISSQYGDSGSTMNSAIEDSTNEEYLPDQKTESEQNTAPAENTAPPQNNVGASGDKVYTLADVAAHNTPSSCWTTIDNKVYDLTTWISRHPGGPKAIQMLCGVDGTSKYTRQHGSSKAAGAALVLLKIGTL